LALTTATDACGVALHAGGDRLVESTLHRPRRHGERLAPLIRDALAHGGKEGSLDAQDLDAVALAAGPGSYTGLRIGASTAKGLCAATGAALAPVPTLDALAEAGRRRGAAPGDVLGAVLRSRRGEVYAAAFRCSADGTLASAFDAQALETEEAARRFEGLRRETNAPDAAATAAWLLGSGAPRVAEALPDDDAAAFRLRADAFPTAGAVARLGAARLAAGTAVDAAAFEPHYLKDVHATPRSGSVFE
jgi:tRNA threonylcarbamoyladenosine biosynthesis protein TsaB